MTDERTAAMDALIADSADMIDAPASADAMGDVERVARIIEPGAWLIYDMAAQCYIEGRGSRGDENYFYERTYKAGCRTLDDYRRWWETCSHSCLEETIFRWRDSSVKATAALSAMSPAGEVERLRAVASGDHARGCQGREYTCTCGFDDERDAALAAMSPAWQDIATAPRNGVVLVYFNDGTIDTATWNNGVWASMRRSFDAVGTHWQPLPAPPEHKP